MCVRCVGYSVVVQLCLAVFRCGSLLVQVRFMCKCVAWVKCVWLSCVVQLIVAWFIGGSVLVQLQFTCMSEFDMVG